MNTYNGSPAPDYLEDCGPEDYLILTEEEEQEENRLISGWENWLQEFLGNDSQDIGPAEDISTSSTEHRDEFAYATEAIHEEMDGWGNKPPNIYRVEVEIDIEGIDLLLRMIPADTDPVYLPQKLKSILEELAHLEPFEAQTFIEERIKPKFGLKRDIVQEILRSVKKRHKELTKKTSPARNNREEVRYIALFPGLIDIVEHEGSSAFLVKRGNDAIIEEDTYIASERYLPPPMSQIPWLLPRAEEALKWIINPEHDVSLYDDLLAYHKSISELPGEAHYDLIVAWDLHTYVQEVIEYSPIICLFAVPERGKSRTGKGMIYVAYRGIHVESLREAYIFRVADNLNASIFFDVMNIWRKAEKQNSDDLLLHRFEKGATVPRVNFPDRGPHQDIVYYSIFGPTIIATNVGIHKILDTRAVSINMPDTEKRFEIDVKPDRALALKERLTAFRARRMNVPLPAIEKPAPGRLGDILKPLLQIITMVKPERCAAFKGLIKELRARRLTDKADSLEAAILTVIIGLRDDVIRGILPNTGILPIKVIADTFNEEVDDLKYRITYQKVGRRLDAMGFSKTRYENKSAIIWDDEKINKLVESYGISEETPAGDTEQSQDDGLLF